MIVVGCDVGSLFTKVVVLDEDQLLASRIARTTGNIAVEIDALIVETIHAAGIAPADVAYTVGTGSGADLLRSAAFTQSEVTCVGAAVGHYLPGVDAAIEMGGQSVAAVSLDALGEPTAFLRNDKCASGSGRFIEMMANKLLLDIEDIDALVADSTTPTAISSQCAVFAESEVIGRINDGMAPADVMAAVCQAVADMVVAQTRRVERAEHYTLTGGVALLAAVIERVSAKLPGAYHAFPFDPRLAGAIGAALLTDQEP